jgi:transposase
MAVLVGPANQHDSVPFEKVIDAVPGIRHGRGSPRRRFKKLHADKAYDFQRGRLACRVRAILSRIARRGVETAEKLGKHRWVVERTFAWSRHFKRLTVRYERRADIHLAFLKLAACLICFSTLG